MNTDSTGYCALAIDSYIPGSSDARNCSGAGGSILGLIIALVIGDGDALTPDLNSVIDELEKEARTLIAGGFIVGVYLAGKLLDSKNRIKQDTYTYILIDTYTQNVVYVGITKNLVNRVAAHRSDPRFAGMELTIVSVTPLLPHYEARIYEQMLISFYTLDYLANKINSISESRFYFHLPEYDMLYFQGS